MNRRLALTAAATTLLLVGAGCSAPRAGRLGGRIGTGRDPTLTVFAAASLTDTFTDARPASSRPPHAGATVTFSFAGSSDLVTQLQQGAPADVFASADTHEHGQGDGRRAWSQGDPVTFATNTLEIAVPPDNPARIARSPTSSKPGVKVVVCAPQVPCGAAAAEGRDGDRRWTLTPVSEENAVTDVLGKVTSGEADAGLVYVTDVQGAGDKVKGIAFDESGEAVNTYPIAVLAGSEKPSWRRQFVELVTGTEGQQVLAAAGFGKP